MIQTPILLCCGVGLRSLNESGAHNIFSSRRELGESSCLAPQWFTLRKESVGIRRFSSEPLREPTARYTHNGRPLWPTCSGTATSGNTHSNQCYMDCCPRHGSRRGFIILRSALSVRGRTRLDASGENGLSFSSAQCASKAGSRTEYSNAALQPVGIRNTWPICRRLTFFTPFRRFRMDTFVP